MSGGWTVTALRYASRPTTRADVFLRYAEYREPDGPQEMTYYLWVLRSGERTIVVDTGFSAAGGGRRGREFLVDPLEALHRVDVDPGGVELLIVTHLHYDHTGHLDTFAHTPTVVSRSEVEFWTGPLAARAQFAAHIESDEVRGLAGRARTGEVTLTEGEHEVTPGVLSIEVGGHSPGQTILAIEGENGPILLTSDAVHFYEEVDRDRACAVLHDLARVYGAYDTIREYVQRGARLVVGHDPLVMDRFPRLESDPELGVLVA
ncbi:MAG: N-acyl homoserine lactonase family protein [Solirubrobacteraceae bacterium]